MVKLAVIFFTMILVDNYVLAKFLGICPFLGVSKKLDSAVGMSLAVTFVMVLATAATWPIQTFLLKEVHPRPVQVPGRVSAPDYHQLHHPGRDHSEPGQRL